MVTNLSGHPHPLASLNLEDSLDSLSEFKIVGDLSENVGTSKHPISPSSIAFRAISTPLETETARNPVRSGPNFEFNLEFAGQNEGLVNLPERAVENTESRPKDLNVGELLGANPLDDNYPAICNCPICSLSSKVFPQETKGLEQAAGTSSLSALPGASDPLDLSRTFFLNSLPGANQTIYLDFDGHSTTGTYWNSGYKKSTINTPAYDFDGNTASFSNAELERIQYIWQRVAEDFIPFNVNVTTQAPTDSNDLIKSGTGDSRWGVRVAIGGSSYDWYGAAAGGVAYLNSFNWNTDTPAFVFEEQLGNGNEKYTAEAITHEAGHTLGLKHDGRTSPSEGYYAGQGSGETGWAPIMGVGYYQNLTQWSKGQYTSANNTEDDLGIISSNNGFGYRADDAGNSIATAGALTVSGTTVSGQGIIERNTDVDFYRFSTGAGAISLTVNPFSRAPNLDISLQLYNSSGAVIASSNPIDRLSASISATVAAGNYYLAIDGVGKGDPLTTGYTDYGSLGQYFIGGTVALNYITGTPGGDTLTGSDGADVFVCQFGQSSAVNPDRIANLAIGTDKIDLLTSGGLAMNAPTLFTRAADSSATTLDELVTAIFTDADGALAGDQSLGINSAVLIQVTTGSIAGTYLAIDDATAGFQQDNDLLLNLTGFTGTLPALGNIAPSGFFA